VVFEFQTELFIPDGISPNGDGTNDFFVIENLLSFYPEASLVLYNRWGDEVWNSYGPYLNNWDGANFQGGQLTDGTYFYVLDFRDGESNPKQGFVGVYRQK
jgi:gliding motility-associated-like protein